jgi:hypothetical protein
MALISTNLNYLWGTMVLPRLGNANHQADAYAWGGSFDPNNINTGTDCSGAVSAELSALVRGPNALYARQFWTGTFAGITPGQTGPFAGISDTTELICIADPTQAPDDYAMIIAIIQTGPDPAQAANAHMICRVGGIDLEMGGQSDNYHSSVTDDTCASVMDTGEFNQWFYLPSDEQTFDPSLVSGAFL